MPFAPMPLFYFPPTLSIQQQTKEMESKSIFVGTQYVCMTEVIDPFSQSFNEIENRIQLVMLTVYINIHSSLQRTWRDSYTITIGDVVSFHSIPIYIVKSENVGNRKRGENSILSVHFFRSIVFDFWYSDQCPITIPSQLVDSRRNRDTTIRTRRLRPYGRDSIAQVNK